MHKVLIIETDREVAGSINRLLEALDIDSEVVYSHPNAIQAYTSGGLNAVFLDVEVPTLSANRVLGEFEDISAQKGQARSPIIFLYQREETVQQQKLAHIPGTVCLNKPVSLVQLYRILERLKLTAIKPDSVELVEERISQYVDFLASSEAWLEKLRDQLPEL